MISFTEWQTPDTPLAVVADATDGAGHVGAMVMPSTVKHAAVAAVEVPTVDIVHVPVAVVVDTIACDLAGVLARVRGQVLVGEHIAFVDHADPHRTAVIGRGNACAAAELIGRRGRGAIHPPQRAIGVLGIVAAEAVGVDPVGFGEVNRGIRAHGFHRLSHGHAGRKLEQRQLAAAIAAASYGLQFLRAQPAAHHRLVGGLSACLELDQQLALLVRHAGPQAVGYKIGTASGRGSGRQAKGNRYRSGQNRRLATLHQVNLTKGVDHRRRSDS